MFIIIYFFQGVEGSWLLGLLAHADHCGTTCQNDDDWVDSFGNGCGVYEDYPTYCDSADEFATDGFDATDKCCICTCTVYTNSSCPSGDRVQRGRDWDYDSYGREDGVVGLGTVTGTAPPPLITTSGTGGNVPKGSACVFPFIYAGNAYFDCITVDNDNVPWCATTPNFDVDGQWGNCRSTAGIIYKVGSGEVGSEQSCDDVCLSIGSSCNLEAIRNLNNEQQIRGVLVQLGYSEFLKNAGFNAGDCGEGGTGWNGHIPFIHPDSNSVLFCPTAVSQQATCDGKSWSRERICACGDTTRPQCWIRMPTGCGQALDETQTPTVWFVDHSVSDAVACAEKVAAYNSWCSKSDGEHDWRTSWCEVTWDQGGSDRYPYRVGAQGAHDLCSAASKKPVSDLPAVFTRVSSSLQWIRATLPELRCNLYTQAHTRTHTHTHTHTLTYSYTHTHTHTHTLTYSYIYIYIYILYVYVSAHTLNSSE